MIPAYLVVLNSVFVHLSMDFEHYNDLIVDEYVLDHLIGRYWELLLEKRLRIIRVHDGLFVPPRAVSLCIHVRFVFTHFFVVYQFDSFENRKKIFLLTIKKYLKNCEIIFKYYIYTHIRLTSKHQKIDIISRSFIK